MSDNVDLNKMAAALYEGANIVAKEPVGFLEAVRTDFNDQRASLGDSINVPFSGAAKADDFTESMALPEGDASTADTLQIKITDSKMTKWKLTGEEMRSLENAGSDKMWATDKIAEGCRTLRNLHEANIFKAVYKAASRATGTAASNPFSSGSIDILADAKKIMLDNGAPQTDMQCIIDSTSVANLLKSDLIQQAQMAGNTSVRDSGVLNSFYGFKLRASAQIAKHVKGTGTGYKLSADEAVGQTVIGLDTGADTVVAGDILTFAADSVNKYVANSDLGSGIVSIGRPGLLIAGTDGDNVAIGNDYTPLPCFERSAVVTINRAPLIGENANVKQFVISDELGYTYLLCQVAGYGMTTWVLHTCFGTKVINPQYVLNLLA